MGAGGERDCASAGENAVGVIEGNDDCRDTLVEVYAICKAE